MTQLQHAAISPTAQRKTPGDLLPDLGITTEIYRTVHGAAATVDQIAHHLDMAANYLYRVCLLPPAGRALPAAKLVPLMRATGDYRILDHLASACDRAILPLPRAAAAKRLDQSVIAAITAEHHEVLAQAMAFIAAPSHRADSDRICSALSRHIGSLAAVRRAVRTARQQDLW